MVLVLKDGEEVRRRRVRVGHHVPSGRSLRECFSQKEGVPCVVRHRWKGQDTVTKSADVWK